MSTILDGKRLRDEIIESLKTKVQNMNKKPCLVVVLVGDDPASKVYIRNKKSACDKIGISSLTYEFPELCTEAELLELIYALNNDKNVNGILLQLPLPKHINEEKILLAIDPIKDVDGFHPFNIGKLCLGSTELVSCTPKGIISLLKHYKIDLQGKNCTVIGRSNIVGKPISLLLTKEDATVTLAHSKTRNLKDLCKGSDILILAVGKERFFDKSYIKTGAVVVDVGINRSLDGKLYGDADFDSVKDVASYVSPVPGGVGPMTIASLMENVLIAYDLQKGNDE